MFDRAAQVKHQVLGDGIVFIKNTILNDQMELLLRLKPACAAICMVSTLRGSTASVTIREHNPAIVSRAVSSSGSGLLMVRTSSPSFQRCSLIVHCCSTDPLLRAGTLHHISPVECLENALKSSLQVPLDMLLSSLQSFSVHTARRLAIDAELGTALRHSGVGCYV